MYGMFAVRSAPCPAPNLQPAPLHAACTAPQSPAAFHLPLRTLAPHRMPSFQLSAGCVGVQPAAELRHLQRHGHELHVLCALLPMPCSISAVESSPAHRRFPPSAASLPAARPVKYALLSNLGRTRRRSTSR
eukprot:scaffold54296_cov36-Phaeocystis_antarctica.AAC.4